MAGFLTDQTQHFFYLARNFEGFFRHFCFNLLKFFVFCSLSPKHIRYIIIVLTQIPEELLDLGSTCMEFLPLLEDELRLFFLGVLAKVDKESVHWEHMDSYHRL